MADLDLEIFVSILGNPPASRNMFSVVAPASISVSRWKESVYAKRQNRLRGYDEADLTLWKLNNPIPLAEVNEVETTFNEQNLLAVAEEMLPRKKLSDYFPTVPTVDGLDVVVVLPSLKTPDNRPSSLPELNRTPEAASRLDRATIQATIDAFVEKSLRPGIKEFLTGPRVSYWSPPEAVAEEIQGLYTTLEIPLVGGKPNLLLHRLRESPNPNGERLFSGKPCLIYCAVSGSGKTRVVFEGLSKHFGFYIVAARGTDGIGSRDLEAVTTLMCDHRDWVQDIFKDRSPEDVTHANTINETIANKAILKVIVARWIIFSAFIQTARTHNGGRLPADIKQDWLLFQVLPSVRIHQMDPFLALIDICLVGADAEVLRSLLAGLNLEEILGPEFNQHTDKFFYVLDEVQVLGERYLGCFSDAGGELPRPVLRPIIRTLTSDTSIPVVVSGTGFSLDNFKTVLASGVGKDSDWETEYSTGDFTDAATQYSYISRYLPLPFLRSPPGVALLDRMYRWLRGRHRFTATFIEALLKGVWHEAGPAAPHKQLNAYIHRLSGCTPHDGNNAFVELEPDVRAMNVETFMWEKIDSKPKLLEELAHSFHTWMTRGKFPIWWEEQESLVEYGLARFIWNQESTVAGASRERPPVIIQEPLALVSIMNHWHSRNLTLVDNIRTRFQSNQGTAFEEVLVFAMTKMLQNKLELSTIFTFWKTPSWASSTAQIMAKTSSGALEVFRDDQLRTPSTEISFHAKNLSDVKYWLQHGQAAWCIPPDSMGPDLMARVTFNDGKMLLLVIQAKCYFTGNIDTLAADVGADAIRTTIPARFFAGSNGGEQQQLDAMLQAIDPQNDQYTTGRYNILRVVAAFPLDVNFNSRSAHVRRALEEDNHELAKLSNTALVSTLADCPEGASIVAMLTASVKKKSRKPEGNDEGGSLSPSKKRKLGEKEGQNSLALA